MSSVMDGQQDDRTGRARVVRMTIHPGQKLCVGPLIVEPGITGIVRLRDARTGIMIMAGPVDDGSIVIGVGLPAGSTVHPAAEPAAAPLVRTGPGGDYVHDHHLN